MTFPCVFCQKPKNTRKSHQKLMSFRRLLDWILKMRGLQIIHGIQQIYSNFKQTFSLKWSLLGKKGRREGCGHWKENPFLPTRFMHHPTKKEGCTNFSLSVAVICFYDDGKSISTIKLFPCFFSRFLVLSLWILLQQPLVTKLDATCCTKVTIEDVS